MKKGLDLNANAMQDVSVLKDSKCMAVFTAYWVVTFGFILWFLNTTAGWEATIGILAIHLVFSLCSLRAPHPRLFNPFKGENLLKPVSAGGRNGVRPASPTPRRKDCIEC